jgi:hypothetical protein
MELELCMRDPVDNCREQACAERLADFAGGLHLAVDICARIDS